MAEFDPRRILEVLADHRVDYVLIGGFAAAIQASPYPTTDIDITPEASPANLGRLSDALRELHARIRTEAAPGGLSFPHDAESLARVELLNLVTDAGDLDVAIRPAGTSGYRDLARDARTRTILGVEVPVASLADVIRSKEAAGRPKDLAQLPVLRRLAEEGYLASCELLADGAVLLTLSSAIPSRHPASIQCVVRHEEGLSWRILDDRAATEIDGGFEVRFPDGFGEGPEWPPPAGRYDVTWVQGTFDASMPEPRRTGSVELASAWFRLSNDGRFETRSR